MFAALGMFCGLLLAVNTGCGKKETPPVVVQVEPAKATTPTAPPTPKPTPKPEPKPEPPPKPIDSDRRAAEWVLKIGGKLRVFAEGKEQDIKSIAELEGKPFRVVVIEFYNNPLADDAGLENLKGLTQLRFLRVGRTEVNGSGFVHLAGMKSLRELDTNSSPIADRNVAHLASVPALRQLWLHTPTITDAAAEHLARIASLETLGLDRSQITDAGLAKLRDLQKLRNLELRGVATVTDAGVDELKKRVAGLTVNREAANPHRLGLSKPQATGLDVEINGGVDSMAGVTRILWNWGDGTPDSNSFFPAKHRYEKPGTYKVQVRSYDDSGAVSTRTTSVTVTKAK